MWLMRRRLVVHLILLTVTFSGVYAQDIVVTPVPHAPFSGTIVIERSFVEPGASELLTLRTVRGVGRDTQGRTFTESRALVPASSNLAPMLTGIDLYDPRTGISTWLDPRQKTFRSATIRQIPGTGPPEAPNDLSESQKPAEGQQVQDLGTQQLMHLPVHGVRTTRMIPAEKTDTGKPIVVTDEAWYSAALHMNVAIRHDDPRSGSVIMAVTQITLTEPDPTLFTIPEGYRPENPPQTAHH